MGRGQELLNAAREGDKRTVEKILGQITNISGPFTRWVQIHVKLFYWFNNEVQSNKDFLRCSNLLFLHVRWLQKSSENVIFVSTMVYCYHIVFF